MKKTIGRNPLTEYFSNSKEVEQIETPQEQPTKIVIKEDVEIKVIAATPKQSKKIKQRVTIHISIDLIERIKNAVFWEPGLTVAGFCEQALEKEIKKLEKEKGSTYPERKEQLKGGRPIK